MASCVTPEPRAKANVRKLWQPGDLFHVTSRYPRKGTALRTDRLAAILRGGLVAPACSEDGSVVSDLNLVVLNCQPPYDGFVFLHRYGHLSPIYTLCEPGRFAVFIDPQFPVTTPAEMGDNWPELCRDEVYVPGLVPPERITGIAIHPADAESILVDLLTEFQRLTLPLYDYAGNVLWPQ